MAEAPMHRDSEVQPLLAAGAMVDHYQVIRLLGRGGMGEVYLARDRSLGRRVALKIVTTEALGHAEARERFLREARITARFNHPHIVTVYGVGQVDEMPYVALEYLEGQNLADRLAEERPGVKNGLRMALAIAEALAEAHRHKVLHRDLKPENVFIPKDGRLRVLDFGLAKRLHTPGAADLTGELYIGPEAASPSASPSPGAAEPDNVFQTHAAGIQGTPQYMSPEQWLMRAGPEADLWALGMILHELFSGVHPFADLDLGGLWRAASDTRPVRSLAEAGPALPPGLVTLVDRCVERAPELRPTAAEVVEALEALLTSSEGRATTTESPFRGLLPFHERHAHQFFGREADVEAFVERLRDAPVLPVVGPSGAGKSSFVQAGVIPRLREHGRWLVLRMRPGSAPFATLASRLLLAKSDTQRLSDFSGEVSGPVPRLDSYEVIGGLAAAPLVGARDPRDTLQDAGEAAVSHRADAALAETVILERSADKGGRVRAPDPGAQNAQGEPKEPPPVSPSSLPAHSQSPSLLAAELSDAPGRLALALGERAERERCRVLLFVDQLEELYTLVPEESTRRAFMRALCTAADDVAGPVRVVFTLRDDFLWRLAEGPEAREVLGRVFVLRPPDAEALAATITRPLEAVGHRFEDDALPVEMVAEVSGEAAALPLLQFAAEQLWQKRDVDGRLLTRRAYQAGGGVAGALARHADHTLEAFTPEQLAVARRLLLRLVTPEGTRRLLGRSEALEGLGPEVDGVLERLAADRIVLPRKGQREPELELVHESLVRTWGRLARWLEESRDERAFLGEALQAATLWQNRGRPDHEVWRGPALADAVRQAGRAEGAPDLVRAFLEAGQRLERRQVRSRRAILASIMGALVLIALGALAFSVALGRKEREARSQRDRAAAERAEAVRQRRKAERRRTEALREGARSALARTELIEARAKLRGALEEADSVLGRAIWWQISESPLLWRVGLNAHLYGVAYSPDGRTIAVASAGQTVHLVDSRTGETRVLRGHGDQVYHVTFSPSGRLLASGAWNGEVIVWELPSGTMRLLSKAGEGGGWGLAFSRDETLLASGGDAKEIRVLEVSTGKIHVTLKGHDASVYALAVSPDGHTLASGSTDNTIRLWDLRAGRSVATLKGHKKWVTRVAFSPDGLQLASASTDHTVRVWSVRTRSTLRVLTGHQAAVYGLAFRPDGRLLASAGHDQVIRLWQLPSGAPAGRLIGHRARIWDLAFSPDGRFLATVSPDQELRLWRVAAASRTAAVHGHSAMVMGVAYSPEGRLIASSAQDSSVRLWNAHEGTVSAVLEGHTAPALAVAFDPKGRWLASAGDDRTVRIWDVATQRTVTVLGGHTGPIQGLAFSPSGALLASCSADHTVRLWDLPRGTLRRELRGHGATVGTAAFDPEGKVLVTGSGDLTIRRWDVASGRTLGVLKGHKGEVHGVAFGPDGKWLASTSEDGTLRIWDARTGRSEVLGRHPGRAYHLSIDPSGRRVATSCSDGVARIWDRVTKRALELRGHRSEVNCLAFSPDGNHIVTTGDDTTVRLWDARRGTPTWRAPLLLESPAELCTHLGCKALGRQPPSSSPSSPTAPIKSRWRAAVEDRAQLAAGSPDGRALCLVTADGRLERWDRLADRQLGAPRPLLGRVTGLLHQGGGCVTLASGVLTRHHPEGPQTLLGRQVEAISRDDDGLLMAEGRSLRVLDAKDRVTHTLPLGTGVTAVARVGHRLALGYRDGGLELRDTRLGAGPFTSFDGTPSSPVMRLVPGPPGTLVAGYGNGELGLWSLGTGARLAHARVHGAIGHLALLGPRLVAASELGQHRVLDLSIFQQPYCTLLGELWREIPILWQGGVARLVPPPGRHRCASGTQLNTSGAAKSRAKTP